MPAGFAGELEIWRLHENFGADIAFKEFLLMCVCKLRFIMEAFLCIQLTFIQCQTLSIGWPTVFRRNWNLAHVVLSSSDKYVAPSWGTYWEMELCPIFFEPLRSSCVHSESNFPFTHWNSKYSSFCPAFPSGLFNFLLSLRPTSVLFSGMVWQENILFLLSSDICHSYSLGFLNKFLPLAHAHWSHFPTIWMFKFVKKFFFLGDCGLFITLFHFLARPWVFAIFQTTFLTTPGTPGNVEILNCSITNLSLQFLLVGCEPGLSYRWQLRESSRSLEGIEFQEGGVFWI